MSLKQKQWINIGKIISNNPDAKLLCPECGESKLIVKDVINKLNHSELERIMYCTNCGARNIIRLRR